MKIWFVLGYLGSGKTTFIKNFLRDNNEKNAVLVNDFGDCDVDAKILSKQGDVYSITGGSIFCSCKSDKFVEMMIRLTQIPLDNIIVETSGLANPFTLMSSLDLIKKNSEQTIELAPVFCIVDCLNLEKILPSIRMIKMQIASSDVVILNKLDLIDTENIYRIKNLICEINPLATIIPTINSKISSYDYVTHVKNLPANIMDISIEKCRLSIGSITLEILDGICKKLSTVCHRIKGVVSICDKKYIYEYINGASKLLDYEGEGECFLILLACGGSLVKNIKILLKDNNYMKIVE